jgi:5-methyltetrahydrofolate--homocysteine methyltransferase
MRGISDLLATLYGGQEFIFAMMSNPDEIMQAAGRLRDFWIEFGRMQLERIPEFYGGIGSFYYNAWAPQGTIWHQEDAAALLSPALFERFIKPFDDEIVKAFDNCIMHLHSTGYVPVEHYLEMDFTALELHIDEGGPSAEKLFEIHKSILERKPLIIWGDIPERDLDWIFSKLPPRGLAVMTVVRSPQEAEMIWRKYLAN